MKSLRNKIHLITYPNSLGKNLKELDFVLDNYFKGLMGGVHVLPFYPSSGDRGFAPLTHLEVDPSFGSWEDIRNISNKYDLTADLMVNHISAKSKQFQDYLKKGKESEYAEYFITNEKFSRRILPHRKRTPVMLGYIENIVNSLRSFDNLFHMVGVSKSSLKKIYRPRKGSPFIPFELKNGKKEYIWCTFTNDQIDLDVYSSGVKDLLQEYISNLAKNGINIIRLDAVGYMIKKRGTNSFMIPETYDFIKWLSEVCHDNGVFVLPEIHNHYSFQLKISNIEEVDFVYDFQLPFLVLHAIYSGNSSSLKKWLRIRPENIISTLDTHDGIPVVDIEDLLTESEIEKVSTKILENGGNESKRASGDNGAENVDTYQINCTYYSALGEDDDAYIVARAIQFFTPGIPQVYYVGLLAGKNDIEKFNKTNVGRDINRHDYSVEEVEEKLQKDVVRRLLKIVEFRNNCPVFDGEFSLGSAADKSQLIFNWNKEGSWLEASIDLQKKSVRVRYIEYGEKEKIIIF